MKYNKVVVTGGSGMVGQSLRKILPDATYLSSKDYDLTIECEVKKMFNDINPDCIVHLGAKVGGIIGNIKSPAEYFTENILMNTNLIDYAYNEKKVIIISPTTFMAYLQSVLYGFKAFKIEESAKEIIKKVEDLGKHLRAYGDYHIKLGNAINTVSNHYNASNKELRKIDKDVLRISGASPEIALLEVEKTKNDPD